MEIIDRLYAGLLIGGMFILAILILCGIVRSVLGPRVADRIIAVNMIGTLTIILIAMLSVYLKESYLVDVCLIYAMISFLAVVVLCKVYTGVYLKRKGMRADNQAIGDNLAGQGAIRGKGDEERGKSR